MNIVGFAPNRGYVSQYSAIQYRHEGLIACRHCGFQAQAEEYKAETRPESLMLGIAPAVGFGRRVRIMWRVYCLNPQCPVGEFVDGLDSFSVARNAWNEIMTGGTRRDNHRG